MPHLSYAAGFQGVADAFLRSPKRYLPFLEFLRNVMEDESELSKPDRETIALYVSKLNGCGYCVGSHGAVLKSYGIDAADRDSALEGRSERPRLQAALTFAGKLTKAPHEVSLLDVEALKSAGWSEQAVEDITCVVSVFGFLNRFVDGLGIEGTSDAFARAGSMVAEKGYGPLVDMAQRQL